MCFLPPPSPGVLAGVLLRDLEPCALRGPPPRGFCSELTLCTLDLVAVRIIQSRGIARCLYMYAISRCWRSHFSTRRIMMSATWLLVVRSPRDSAHSSSGSTPIGKFRGFSGTFSCSTRSASSLASSSYIFRSSMLLSSHVRMRSSRTISCRYASPTETAGCAWCEMLVWLLPLDPMMPPSAGPPQLCAAGIPAPSPHSAQLARRTPNGTPFPRSGG
mmetsp:Transcript_20368/g.51441  ORF Transcript_20368/g.51441 Transcript_20368/m.51441 type:complete len:217 (-) Transcript_20368:2502-3152(-)